MSVSPPGCRVDLAGIEPASPARQAGVVPLDQRPVCQWTAGDSNPDSRLAKPVSSRWTSSPFRTVETVGIEPTPRCLQGTLAALVTCIPVTPDKGPPGARTRSSPLPKGRAAATPADPIPPGRKGGRATVGAAPAPVFPAGRRAARTSAVAEAGVEPAIDHQALDLAALPDLRTRPSSNSPGPEVSHLACGGYEPPPGTGPPGKNSRGGRIRTDVGRLMRPCWILPPVHPANETVTKGRVALPRPEGHGVLSPARLLVPPLGPSPAGRVPAPRFRAGPVPPSRRDSSLQGSRTPLPGLRSRRHHRTPSRPFVSVRRAGVEPAQRSRAGYSRLGSPVPGRRIFLRNAGGVARAMLSRPVTGPRAGERLRGRESMPPRTPVARAGVEPAIGHRGLSPAALPVCVPRRRSAPYGDCTRLRLLDRQVATLVAPRSETRTVPGVGIEPTRPWFRARCHYQQRRPRSFAPPARGRSGRGRP